MKPPPRDVFGRAYPPPLKDVMNHAERLRVALSLSHADALGRASPSPALVLGSELWLSGRVDELDALVDDVIVDLEAGRIEMIEAAWVIDRYMDEVHRGMSARVLGGGRPSCCTRRECVTFDAGQSGGPAVSRTPLPLGEPTERSAFPPAE